MPTKTIFKIILGFVFVVSAFTFDVEKIEAQTYVEGSATMVSGTVTDISGSEAIFPTLGIDYSSTAGFYICVNNSGKYQGAYPATTTSLGTGCIGGNYWEQSAYESINLETFFGTTDGDYWFYVDYGEKTGGGFPCCFTETSRIYFKYNRTGGVWSFTGGTPPDYSTRIIDIIPTDGDIIATSTTNTFLYNGYYNADDLNSGSKVRFTVQNSAQSFTQCSSAICSDLANNSYSFTNTQDINSAGDFSYSTEEGELPIGKYYVTTTIQNGQYCLFGFCALSRDIFATSTTFIVGTTTKADALKDDVIEYMNTIAGAGGTFEDCSVTSFDFFDCMSDLIAYAFVPTPDAVEYTTNQMKETVLTKFPIGFVTDFIQIIATSTTKNLVVIDATLPMFGNPTIQLDITNSLDYVLNATTSEFFNSDVASSTETFWDITSNYWKILMYILALVYILRRILGAGIIPKKI